MSPIAQALMLAFSSNVVPAPPGEIIYNNPAGGSATTSGVPGLLFVDFVVPAGITEISFVLVAGGLGNGSAANSRGTTALADTYFAYGSTSVGGGWSATTDTNTASYGGANGGDAGVSTGSYGAGGGGAAGYTGNGGKGGDASTSGTAGANASGGSGGGVGLFGQGTSGFAGSGSTAVNNGTAGSGGGGGGGGGAKRGEGPPGPGSGGSGGTAGTTTRNTEGYYGGNYGGGYGGYSSSFMPTGGGGLMWKNNLRVTPGQVIKLQIGANGAIRIIWNGNRSFPLNAPAV